MGDVKVYAFLKLSKAEYLQRLRNDGLLHLKPLRYFAELEDPEKGDAFEGLDTIMQPKRVGELTLSTNMSLGSIAVAPQDLAGPVRISLDRIMDCNVYCLFALTGPVAGALVDKRNLGLGDSFLLILNPHEFRQRVFSAANDAGLNCQAGGVEYYDGENYSGAVGPFRKRSLYAHQNEYRFVVWPGSTAPVELSAGSMQDITSEVLPASYLSDSWHTFGILPHNSSGSTESAGTQNQ